MKIYIIGKPEKFANPFFNKVLEFSDFDFVYKKWSSFNPEDGCVILFQWPERIFNWREPSDNLLDIFDERLKKWKTKTRIIYQVHNIKRHFGMNERYRRLYEIVESNAEYMIHFGHYSKNEFENKYPDKNHWVINHPLYGDPFKFFPKEEARKKLGISMKKQIMISPGRVRSFEERELILDAFKFLKVKSKYLIVPQMKYRSSQLEFKGRHFLKKILDVREYQEQRWNRFNTHNHLISYDFHSFEDLSVKISASDFIFIPRLDILNSGIVYLALTFNKPFVGPKIGNITEVLKSFNLPGFNVNDKRSLKRAMNNSVLTGDKSFSYNETHLEPYQAKCVAKKWDNLFNEI